MDLVKHVHHHSELSDLGTSQQHSWQNMCVGKELKQMIFRGKQMSSMAFVIQSSAQSAAALFGVLDT